MKEKIAKPRKFQQNTEVKTHFHPRGLARAVIHNQAALQGATGINKVKPGTTQSPFARFWRDEADELVSVSRMNRKARRHYRHGT